MALSLDGQAGFGSFGAGNTFISGTLTTANTNDVLVAVCFIENVINSSLTTTTSVKLTTAGTAFTKFTSLTSDSFNELSIWWLASASTISDTITATASGTNDNSCLNVFGVSGANTTTPWDTAVGSPYSASNTTNVAPSVSGVSTAAANAMLLGFGSTDGASSTGNVTQTAGAMAGTTGTFLTAGQGGSGANSYTEYRILSSTISSQSVAFGTTNASNNPWSVIAAAIVQASTGDTFGNPMQLLNI